MEKNYNETDAAIFVQKHVSPQIRQKYSTDKIGYLLDLVYEYYDSVDVGDDGISIIEITTFVNKNIKNNFCKPITHQELVQLLDADDLYKESIGLIEAQNDAENSEDYFVNIEDIIDDVYKLLPNDLKDKYTSDDIFVILCIESEYICDSPKEEIDENVILEHIMKKAKETIAKEISLDEIKQILSTEYHFLGED
ncbi:MAG: hypothetical protein LBQ28_05710 [Prevotellaceae bacterium]|jgi:hypothetical protein|nr:hypothetical protein [Prevotellaceae bacterium]